MIRKRSLYSYWFAGNLASWHFLQGIGCNSMGSLGNVLLHAVRFYNGISTCSKSVEQTSTNIILDSWNITDLQKLQKEKPTWAVQFKLIRLEFLPTKLKKSEVLQIHQRATKYIAINEYNEDCCVLDSSVNDYLKEASIRKKRSYQYHVEVFSRQTLRVEFFAESLRLNLFSRKDFHMVTLTVAEDIFEGCRPKTSSFVPMFKSACR